MQPVYGTVPAENRSYFDVKVPVQAASYRVAVDTFDFLEQPSA